jgi:O-acetyl-ADP-ribose deacetylase (regulator of RNase III)
MDIKTVLGDITTIPVDAIVNAANNSLLGGGGVDGAIHRAAGPELLRECKTLGGCKTGDAKITRAYHLPARYVIHTVGPIYRGGHHKEADLLASCYRKSIQLATQNKAYVVSFPCISTGVYHYPKKEACIIAVLSVTDAISALKKEEIMQIRFVCYDEESFLLYQNELKKIQ